MLSTRPFVGKLRFTGDGLSMENLVRISKSISLTLLTLLIASCGSSDISGPFGAASQQETTTAPVENITVVSNAVKGPLRDTTVTLTDANGVLVNSFTASTGSGFNLSVPSDTIFPVVVSTSGGIDTFTNQDVSTVGLTLKGVMFSVDQNTVNINPLSTLMVEIALATNALNEETMRDVFLSLQGYSFGLPEGFDPVSSLQNSVNTPNVLMAYETFFEAIRRTAAVRVLEPNAVVLSIAADLTDSVLDGVGAGATDAITTAVFNNFIAVVLLEAIAGELVLDDGGANQRTLLDDDVQVAVLAITGEENPGSMAALPVSSRVATLLSNALEISRASTVSADEALLIDTALTSVSAIDQGFVVNANTSQEIGVVLQAIAESLKSIAVSVVGDESLTMAANLRAGEVLALEVGNAIPMPVSDFISVDAGTVTQLDVLANDPAVEDGFAALSVVQDPIHGSVLVRSDTTLWYIADDEFFGTDSLIYGVIDEDGDRGAASVTITVNTLPTAVDDNVGTQDITPVSVSVLANDLGLQDAPIIVSIQSATNGTAIVDNNVVTFTAAGNFSGTAIVSYVVTDASGDSSSGDLSVFVASILPVAVPDAFDVPSGELGTFNVLANDLQLTDLPITLVAQSTNAAISILDGVIQYRSNAGFGGVDTFSYTITDGSGDIATSEVQVFVDSTPIALARSVVFLPNTSIFVDLLEGASGLLNPPITVAIRKSPNFGIIQLDSGTLTYTSQSAVGENDSLDFALIDADGDTSVATLSLLGDMTPLPLPDSVDTFVATSIEINPLANDSGLGNVPTSISISDPENGSAMLVGTTITYTPNDGFAGTDSFSYIVTDVDGDAGTGTISVFVDDTPVAVADSSLETSPGTVLVDIQVLGNDRGLGNAPISISIGSSSDNGTVSVNAATNSLDYTPAPGFTGIDTFVYVVTDADGDTATATVTVNVDGDPLPIAQNLETLANTEIIIDLLSGATGLSDTPLTFAITSSAQNGTTTLIGSTAAYQPNSNFTATDSFAFSITDSDAGVGSATVTIFVDDLPVAIADAGIETSLDTALLGIQVLGNDTGLGNPPLTVAISAGPSNGSVSVDAETNAIDYSPTQGFYGLDTFSYLVTDADGDTATALVTVNVDAEPMPIDQNLETQVDTALVVDLLSAAIGLNDTPLAFFVTAPAENGTVTIEGSNASYQPSADFAATDSFAYSITDADGGVGTAIVTVFVDDQPVANADGIFETLLDTPLLDIQVLSNDLGLGNVPISIAINTPPGNGSASVNEVTNTVVYTPTASFDGLDTFSYIVSDADGDTATATVTVDVDAEPIPVPQNLETPPNTAIVIDLLEGATGLSDTPLAFAITLDPQSGTATLDGSSVSYLPGTDFAETDTFSFSVTDSEGDTGLSTVTIFVDDMPVAVADGLLEAEKLETLVDTELANIQVLSNDTGLLNIPISVTIDSQSGGVATANESGSVSFVPALGAVSEANFVYRLTDNDGDSSAATASIFIDDVPVGNDDDAMTGFNLEASIDILVNDTGLGNVPVEATLVTEPGNGLAVITANVANYTPDTDFTGTDTFTYRVEDVDGDIASATATILVDGVPDPQPDTAETPINVPITIDVLANDLMVGNTPLVLSANDGLKGTISISSGTITYTPNLDEASDDSFDYTVVDAQGDSGGSSVAVYIDDSPVANSDAVNTEIGVPVNIPVTDNDEGLRNGLKSVTIETQPDRGSVAVVGNTVTYTPDTSGQSYETNFSYRITDEDDDASIAGVQVNHGCCKITVSWNPPATRADGSALPLAEIDGYSIVYTTMADSRERYFDDGATRFLNSALGTTYTTSIQPTGKYFIKVRSVDDKGILGTFSTDVEVEF